MNVFYGPYYSESATTTKKPFDGTEMPIEVDQSSGFHVFELHAPTAGVSFFALIFALIAIGLAYGCYRRCCSASLLLPRFQSHPMNAMPQGIPMQPMPTAQPAPPVQDPLQPLLSMVALQRAISGPAAPSAPPPLSYEAPRGQREPPGFIYTLPEEPAVQSRPPRPAVAPQATPSASKCFTEDL